MRFSQFEQNAYRQFRFQLIRTGLALALLLVTFFAFAVEAGVAAESPDWLQLCLGLFGGLALFLAGLQMLSDGMKKAAGQALKTGLARLTTNRFKGALTGAFVTGVLNSSTVTTLLVGIIGVRLLFFCFVKKSNYSLTPINFQSDPRLISRPVCVEYLIALSSKLMIAWNSRSRSPSSCGFASS